MRKIFSYFIAGGLIAVAVFSVLRATSKKPDTAVPFLKQAPTNEWGDARQQEGCEEASVLMAVAWAQGKTLSTTEGRTAIISMADWEKEHYGYFEDTSAQDTADRLFKEYLGFKNIETRFDIDMEDIKRELADGHIILVPMNGRALGNPYYSPPGPQRHMIVIVGYDASKDEFVTNDPGTSHGAGYRYKRSVIQSALRDYPSGTFAPIDDRPTAMIVVKK